MRVPERRSASMSCDRRWRRSACGCSRTGSYASSPQAPFSDGTVAVDLDPLSLLCRLAAAVHPPKFHVVGYAGVLTSAPHLRSLVVPPLADEDKIESVHTHASENERPPTHRSAYRPWAELMKRSFAIEVDKCDQCGAGLRLRALVTAAASIDRYLRYLGEPTELPPLSPARGPPFFKSRVLRRKLGELEGVAERQMQMFSS